MGLSVMLKSIPAPLPPKAWLDPVEKDWWLGSDDLGFRFLKKKGPFDGWEHVGINGLHFEIYIYIISICIYT